MSTFDGHFDGEVEVFSDGVRRNDDPTVDSERLLGSPDQASVDEPLAGIEEIKSLDAVYVLSGLSSHF